MNENIYEYKISNTDTNEAIRKQASIGLHLIKESILEVLYDAKLNGNEWVKSSHVRRQIGMPKTPEPSDMGNASVRHMLLILKDEGKTEQSKKGGPWRLSYTEFQKKNEKST